MDFIKKGRIHNIINFVGMTTGPSAVNHVGISIADSRRKLYIMYLSLTQFTTPSSLLSLHALSANIECSPLHKILHHRQCCFRRIPNCHLGYQR